MNCFRSKLAARSRGHWTPSVVLIGLVSICLSLIASSLIVFSVFEAFPSLINWANLDRIKYYALRGNYVSDPSLVFVYRDAERIRIGIHYGDQYKPAYGPAPGIPIAMSYHNGFRVNSSRAPFKVLVVGDSFVEVGETDLDTVSEKLSVVAGLSTINLGIGWYGPYQYLELLKRYAPAIKPQYALMLFYGGNDFGDIVEYQRWLEGEQYRFFVDPLQYSFLRRYLWAVTDIWDFAGKILTGARGNIQDLAIVQLREKRVPMRFCCFYQQPQLLASSEGQKVVKQILSEFKSICEVHGIIPVFVFVPSKTDVYREYYTEESGAAVVRAIKAHTAAEQATEVLTIITSKLDIKMINLLPYFKKFARDGNLLYHPFDTHWNSEGRGQAASVIAAEMNWTAHSTEGSRP